ncbi:MAG: hypothetical protein ACC645_10895 [Pirellulales bacterium]
MNFLTTIAVMITQAAVARGDTAVLRADLDRAPAVASAPKPHPITPPTSAELDEAIDRGQRFLLSHQNKDGSWGSARRTKSLNIYAPVPGAHHAFRSAVTALCVSSLIETGPAGGEIGDARRRGEAWLLENLPRLRRANATALYNVWGHAYGIQALVAMARTLAADDQRRKEIERLIAGQIDRLERYEFVNGGWGYYDFQAHTQKPSGSPTSFTTATALIALHEAKELGVPVPEKMVQRALTSLRRQQKNDFSYAYGEYLRFYPMMGINRPAGSLGRSQACNLAQKLWGNRKITDQVLTTWLDRLFARNGWLSMGRKRPVPHESWNQVAGYFYYYGHYYGARCLKQLPDVDQVAYQQQMAHVLLAHQEADGSWWDFPLYDYHQPYGTAFALMTLVRCRATTEP